MGEYRDQNEELREDRNFEHKRGDKKPEKDGDGRYIPESSNEDEREDRYDDGGAHGRNNGADKSGR